MRLGESAAVAQNRLGSRRQHERVGTSLRATFTANPRQPRPIHNGPRLVVVQLPLVVDDCWAAGCRDLDLRAPHPHPPVVAGGATGGGLLLSGGVGGARLAAGLAAIGPPERLTVVVNTADDFEPYGLRVSPDLDTVLYTLAGVVNEQTGWGVAGDTSAVMGALRDLGDDAWFHLSDRDVATHLVRTGWMTAGARPTEAARRLAEALGVRTRVLPATDAPVRTVIQTARGDMAFQEWFVRARCEPPAIGLRYEGAETARPTPEVLSALHDAAWIVVGPSNPYLSIGPMLALPGFVEALTVAEAPVVAVSPIIGGRAVKGPAGRMLTDMAGEASPTAIAQMYRLFLDGMVIDATDAEESDRIRAMGIEVHVCDTLMSGPPARARLAAEVVAFAERLASR